MAETAVDSTTKTDSGRHGGPRPGAGRKPGSGNRPPQTPPTPQPAAETTADDFFSLLKTFPEDDWKERKFMYLYRTAPITDRRASGQDLNLMKYMKPIDSHDIMLEFGSGGYKILLDEYDPTTQKTRVLRTHYFRIFNMDYPPRIPYGEWLDDERNKDWQWAKPKLLAQQTAANTPPAVPAVGNEVGLFNAVVSAVEKLRPNENKKEHESLAVQVMKMMQEGQREAAAANNPKATLELVNAIVGAIKPDKPAGADPMLTHILDELKTAREENSKLMMRLLDRKDEPKTKSVREELIEIKQVADEFFGGSGGKSKTDWGDIAKEVALEGLHVVAEVAKAIGIAKVTGKPATPGAEAANPQAALPEPDPSKPLTPEQRREMLAALNEQFGGILDAVAPFMVDQFKSGVTGMEFRDWFLDRYGSLTYDALAQMSKETILALIDVRKQQGPPHIKNILAEFVPPERAAEFVAEFQSDTEVPEDEDSGTEPPTAATSGTSGRAPDTF